MSDTEPIRVMLAGDCPLLRSGFRQVLETAGIAVVGSVATVADAATLLTINVAEPVLVTETSLEALVVATTTFPNVREVGERLTDCAALS